MPPHSNRSTLCTPVNRLCRHNQNSKRRNSIPNIVVQMHIRFVAANSIGFHPHTCAQHPEPTSPSSSNFANKSCQEEPYVVSSRRSVYTQECGVTFRCNLENMSQMSGEKMSLRVDIHWPNLTKIGPRNSTPKKNSVYTTFFTY